MKDNQDIPDLLNTSFNSICSIRGLVNRAESNLVSELGLITMPLIGFPFDNFFITQPI